MPFLDHLEELRWRLLKSLLAIAVGTALGWFLVQHFDLVGLLKRPIAPLLPDGRLAFTSPTEPLMLTLKLAFGVGLLVASPVVIYQAWAFLAPALYDREKRLIVPALTAGLGLFMLGATACYLWVLPAALRVLFEFQRADLAPFITIDRYFSFATQLVVAFGVVTELPLVMAILAALGLVTPQFLARHRRYAVVLAALVAAFLTPPDALSMIMMLVPLLLLYEVSILCAWIASRRRGRRQAAGTAGTSTPLALLVAGLGLAAAGSALAQQPRPAPPPPRPDTTAARGATPTGRTLDTATARRLGLPTAPTRSFPPSDAVMDSLLRQAGYRVTRYVAETLVVQGDSQLIVLRGEAYVEREGTRLEADSVRYREASCRLDARGTPRLFDEGTVLVGEGMRYDTCIKRGIVEDALTDFQQGGATWFMRGDLAVDSGATRVFGSSSDVTSCDLPVAHYHFSAGQVKWLNKNVMVARPAVLHVRDVPVLWLPFIFQDIRSGRHSGMLVPRFGVNDLVRTSRTYERHIANLGYYFAINDYLDLLVAGDWFSNRNIRLHSQLQYRWLDRFITGSLTFAHIEELDLEGQSSYLAWNHGQSFNSRTRLNMSLNYATSGRVVQQNVVNPYVATAQLTSSANFDKRMAWGTLNIGGNRSQNLSNDLVQQTFPEIRLTPSPVNITPSITWSPAFSLSNRQTLNNPAAALLVPGAGGVPDTLTGTFDDRLTSLAFGTPLRLGRWNWNNSVVVTDRTSGQRREFVIPDSTVPGGARRVVYAETFETAVDWETGINLPQVFSGTWKLQPSIQVLNTTTAGPFMLRNQFSGGDFVTQGKRLAFSAGIRPSFFGFFPGFGPLQRIRHTFSPIVDYRYAPGARVPEDYARALDPTGTTLNVRTDPQQTLVVGLSQNFEGKLRAPAGDTTGRDPPRIRLLSINTSSVSYNFEQAKQPGRVGWQTQSMTNTFASDLLRGFNLQLTHDLWDGPVGLDTTRFDPFLVSVAANFAITPATLRGIGALVGLGGGRSVAAPPAASAGADTGRVGPTQQPSIRSRYPGAGVYGPALGQGFSLTIGYSATRQRGQAASGAGGQRQVQANLTFNPTPKWQAGWNTSYDFDTGQFAQHILRFERDLHRWRASFSFVKSATGNFAFNFGIALIDQAGIKFDYDQETYR